MLFCKFWSIFLVLQVVDVRGCKRWYLHLICIEFFSGGRNKRRRTLILVANRARARDARTSMFSMDGTKRADPKLGCTRAVCMLIGSSAWDLTHCVWSSDPDAWCVSVTRKYKSYATPSQSIRVRDTTLTSCKTCLVCPLLQQLGSATLPDIELIIKKHQTLVTVKSFSTEPVLERVVPIGPSTDTSKTFYSIYLQLVSINI